MRNEDQDFHERRVEEESRRALEAASPQAARAHTQLAALHSEQAKPKAKRVSAPVIDRPLPY